MPKGKHLTLDERQKIQLGLNENISFKQIAENIGKDPSTVSKEVRNHITTKFTVKFNPCANLKECTHYRDLCSPCNNYIDAGLLSVGNIDLLRKVRYRIRKKKRPVRVDKKCFVGRTYEDFQMFLITYPDTNVVEMDSVEGRKGGKVLLTIYFRNCELMLAFLRDANTARSVTDVFNRLYRCLGSDVFKELFKIILTDRGSEFTDPLSIEFNEKSEIRRVLPKGTSFDHLSQADINLMMSHINSYTRKKPGNQSPHQLFSSFYGDGILKQLNIKKIPPNDINLTPKLLNK